MCVYICICVVVCFSRELLTNIQDTLSYFYFCAFLFIISFLELTDVFGTFSEANDIYGV